MRLSVYSVFQCKHICSMEFFFLACHHDYDSCMMVKRWVVFLCSRVSECKSAVSIVCAGDSAAGLLMQVARPAIQMAGVCGGPYFNNWHCYEAWEGVLVAVLAPWWYEINKASSSAVSCWWHYCCIQTFLYIVLVMSSLATHTYILI